MNNEDKDLYLECAKALGVDRKTAKETVLRAVYQHLGTEVLDRIPLWCLSTLRNRYEADVASGEWDPIRKV